MSSDTPKDRRKKKLTKSQKEKRSRFAEKLKGRPGIKEPFALATFLAKRKKKTGRRR